MSDSFQIVLAKLRIGQMNDPISLIVNSPNRATKRPAKVLDEMGSLGVHGAQVGCGEGAFWIRLPQAAKRRGPLNSKYFGSADRLDRALLPRHGSLTKEDQVNKNAQHYYPTD